MDHILSHQKYSDDQIGPAYKPVKMSTGRSLKYLVTPARIKKYNDNRPQFEGVNPPLPQMKADQSTPKGMLTNGQTDDHNDKPNSSDESGFEPAVRINRQRMIRGKPEYLVLFRDGSQHWCDAVTQSLLDNFRMRQERLRENQRKRKKTAEIINYMPRSRRD